MRNILFYLKAQVFKNKRPVILSKCFPIVGRTDLNMTIAGGLDTCELNTPTAVGMAKNGSMYIGTLKDGTHQSYSLKAESSVYQMPALGQSDITDLYHWFAFTNDSGGLAILGSF